VALVIDVPVNTMLADLDETLRVLLRRELGRHGFDGVEVAFDAPSREWSGQLAAPTVDLFLYDLRESERTRIAEWDSVVGNGGSTREVRPPLTVDCSYAVTAWTQEVEDEHRLLSQVLAVLFAYRRLPADVLHGRLQNGAQRFALEGRVGGARGEKADFWNAVGGQYKASLDYVVTLSVESGTVRERGPEVRSQKIVTRERNGGASAVQELHRVAGRVVDAGGRPLAGVWVTLPEVGSWGASDDAGRFRLERVPPGAHRCVARDRDGREAEAELRVPGDALTVVLER
jgi:hypothetical protein